MVIRRQIDAPVPRLDAEVSIGGRLGPGEAVVLRMYGRLALHAESVTLPLLAPDAPVVTWWHGAAAGADRLRPARACSPTGGSPTSAAGERPGGGAAAAGGRLRARRHRPRLDADHPLAGGAGLGVRRGARPAGEGGRARRRVATRRRCCWPAGCPPGSGSTSRSRPTTADEIDDGRRRPRRRQRDRARHATAAGWCCGATSQPETIAAVRRAHASASCWPRSCAASTTTRSTPRRWARCAGSTASPTVRATRVHIWNDPALADSATELMAAR